MVGKSHGNSRLYSSTVDRFLPRVLEDVVDRHHHNHAGQRRRDGRKHEAQPDTAYRVRIGEQTGDGVGPRLELAAVGHELIILLPQRS